MGAELRSRSDILGDWFAATGELVRGMGGVEDPAVGLAAALSSYEARTAAVRALTRAPAYWEAITQDERDKAADEGQAMPDGSYPILACEGDNSVDSAIAAVGMGGADHDAIRRHIMKRADALGCTGKIPDTWNSDGSLKEAAAAAAGQSFVPGAPGHEVPPPGPGAEAPTPDAKPEEGKPAADAPDTEVDKALAAIDKAIADAEAAERADMVEDGETTSKIIDGLNALKSQMLKIRADQQADEKEEAGGAEEKPPPAEGEAKPPPAAPPPPAAAAAGVTAAGQPGGPQGVAGDADDSPPGPGDIDNSVKCENPDCTHMASSHGDTDDGKNTGACAMAGCSCPGMVYSGVGAATGEGKPAPKEGEETPPPAQAAASGHAALAAAVEANRGAFAPPGAPPAGPGAPPEAPQAPPVEGAPAAELPPLDPMPTAVVGPAFTCPVMWLEGVPTGDGRQVEPDALTWRTPPLPLMGLKTSPHDPSGFSPNDPAVLIGRIEEITRDGNKGVAKGHLLATEDGEEWATILEQMGRMGVSIDVGSAQIQVMPDPSAPPSTDVFDLPLIESLTKGEVMGATACPFAAFAGAYIVLGDGTGAPEAELAAPPSGAKLAWREVAPETCEPCEAGAGLVASAGSSTAGGPIAPPKAWFDDPAFGKSSRDDVRLVETIDSKTGRPSGKFACPMTVTDDGRVYGHIAQWGVCHQSPKFLNNGQCVMAPRSRIGYAAFHRGHIRTAEGELVAVGALTADAGHAPEQGITAAQALAHYDNSALTAALVRAGEDEHGIWVSGSLHPSASPEQVVTLRANPPSGDWRPFGAGNELRAVLHVNVAGFPQVHATYDRGRMTSLVAAGVPMFSLPAEEKPPPTLEERMAAIEHTVTPLLPYASRRLQEEMAALRG